MELNFVETIEGKEWEAEFEATSIQWHSLAAVVYLDYHLV